MPSKKQLIPTQNTFSMQNNAQQPVNLAAQPQQTQPIQPIQSKFICKTCHSHGHLSRHFNRFIFFFFSLLQSYRRHRLNHCSSLCHHVRNAFYIQKLTSNTSKAYKMNRVSLRHGRRHCVRHAKQHHQSMHRNCHCIGSDRNPMKNLKIRSMPYGHCETT